MILDLKNKTVQIGGALKTILNATKQSNAKEQHNITVKYTRRATEKRCSSYFAAIFFSFIITFLL